ncbi:hypothetical protein VHUM_00286 [Vanrija humicola]|uniref:2-oxoadipate dioxygenase/decarboxylase n=1 Tax=Vanrija humicola TaxID=5417 RepID=A0A7D8Z7W7_VANHU|nr:hypothetical protein VHUM_00286 [Vanrija humicola]
MYRAEVPLYGDLIELVDDVNAETGIKPEDRLKVERHGAIRLGKPDELAMIARLFAQMGMEPVGYYDLSPVGVPVHATAFRPTLRSSLAYNPFRVFTSLLLPELLEPELRAEVEAVLAKRDIFQPEVRTLVAKSEAEGGLVEADAALLVEKALDTFRWHDAALVTRDVYDRMHDAHALVADIAAFKGPHINHLTPRVLDIDAAQEGMSRRGITPKTIIEGPPRRACEILLRQTSFQALTEPINFPGGGAAAAGSHRARFGEIEQRGCALTRKGHALYLELMSQIPAAVDNASHQKALAKVFEKFPDSWEEMAAQGLGYFEYALAGAAPAEPTPLAELVAAGVVSQSPVTYEDFLPASAAGIFQSNLDSPGKRSPSPPARNATREKFAALLPIELRDSFALHEEIQESSIRKLEQQLGWKLPA